MTIAHTANHLSNFFDAFSAFGQPYKPPSTVLV